MIYLLLFAIVVYVAYTIAIFAKFGVPKSYSDTYYLFGKKWYFSAVMATIAFSGAIAGLDTGGEWNFLAFIPAAALLFVSAAPDFKFKGDNPSLENKVHMVDSYVAVAGATFAFWLKFDCAYCAIGYVVFLVIIKLWNPKGVTFWVEHVCFDIYFALLLISIL